jgi:NADPH:quinone reductase-like Zn-dependent oxidoreductase
MPIHAKKCWCQIGRGGEKISPIGSGANYKTLVDASGLPAADCTAIQAPAPAGTKRGDKLLITGGSGDLATILLQAAKAVVEETGVGVATCSGRSNRW